MRRFIEQIIKFGIVGILAFIIDYTLLFICVDMLGINYLVGSCISFSVSVIFNYLASVIWVFNIDKGKDKKKTFCVFILLSLIGLGINQIIMWIGVEILDMYYMLVKIFATALVMVFNFITRKLFLEKGK